MPCHAMPRDAVAFSWHHGMHAMACCHAMPGKAQTAIDNIGHSLHESTPNMALLLALALVSVAAAAHTEQLWRSGSSFAFLVHELLSESECDALITLAKTHHFEEARVGDRRLDKKVRKVNTTSLVSGYWGGGEGEGG